MSEHVETVREALEQAYDAAEKTAPPPPRPVRTEPRPERRENGESRTETRSEPPDSEKRGGISESADDETGDERTEPTERRGDRPRDQFGRFLSATPAARPARQEAPQEAPEPETESPDQPEPEALEQAHEPAILAPQAWSAAAKDAWHQLPRAIQAEVDRREREVSRAFQQRAEQNNTLEPIAQAIQPYSQKLALRGVNPATAVQQLLAVQDLLDRDPIQGVAHVARVYGVDLRQYAAAYQQAQQPQDPAVQQLAQRVAQQDQLLQSWQASAEAQQRAAINDEVQRFAADTRNYPYFEHVRQRMAELMATGGATSLAQAYRLACADNEQISTAIAQAQRQAERAQRSVQEKQAADRARKAAVSVSGAPYGGSAGAGRGGKPRGLKDELNAVYDELAGNR